MALVAPSNLPMANLNLDATRLALGNVAGKKDFTSSLGLAECHCQTCLLLPLQIEPRIEPRKQCDIETLCRSSNIATVHIATQGFLKDNLLTCFARAAFGNVRATL